MRRISMTTAIAAMAWGAASMTAAASPFSHQLSTGTDHAGAEAPKQESAGILDATIKATGTALRAIFAAAEDNTTPGTKAEAGAESDIGSIVHGKPSRSADCDAEKGDETVAGNKKAQRKKPQGPEPIYFGF